MVRSLAVLTLAASLLGACDNNRRPSTSGDTDDRRSGHAASCDHHTDARATDSHTYCSRSSSTTAHTHS